MSGRMNLLGAFSLEYAGKDVQVASPRIQTLLAYLALHYPVPQSRQHLAFMLWPDSSESQAFTNLRTLLHRMNAILPDRIQLLHIDSQNVAWNPDTGIVLDVTEFKTALDRANAAVKQDDATAACEALDEAIDLYRGDLLPACYDDWILAERDHLQLVLLTVIERVVALLEQLRHYDKAIPYARWLVRLDPLNEAAYLALMRLHTLSGERTSALRVYHQCASILDEELGVVPGSVLTDAYERLLALETLPLDDSQSNFKFPLVGRDHEWQRMQAIWDVASAGRARLLLLTGEAGIGKTRLAEDLLRWAHRQGFVTALTRCYPAEGTLAYAPLVDLIRSDSLRNGIAQLTPQWLLEITRLAPDLVGATAKIAAPGPVTEPWQRQRLFEALARLVLTASRPSLLLIDDLQWCDQDTLEWLHFLLRYEPGARLLVIGTVRTEEVGVNHPVAELMEVLNRESRLTELALVPLDRQNTAELAHHFLGGNLSPEQADILFSETEGNPLFIVESLRTDLQLPVSGETIETGQLPAKQTNTVASDLSPPVLAIITRRLSQLSPKTHELVDVAAVIGRSFSVDVLAHATDLSENELVRGLDELWQKRILREQGSNGYDFTHGKLCQVAYTELSTVRQRSLHRRVATALQEVYAADLDPVSGQIAMHCEQAGLAEKAVVFYQQAAAYSRYLYANNSAISYYQHALDLLAESAQRQRLELYDQLGELFHFIGQYEAAREVWLNALNLAEDHLTRANLRCKMGNAWRDQYHYDEALQAYAIAEDVLDKLDGDEEAIWHCWGQIKLEYMNALYWLGQSREMLRLLDEVRPVFEQQGTVVQQARLHQISAMSLLRHHRYTQSSDAVDHASAYLELVRTMEDTNALPAAHFMLGFALLWASGNTVLAQQQIQSALAMAEQRGDISLVARCLTYLTVIARQQEHIEQVQSYAERSLLVATSAQMHEYIGASQGNLAWVAWRAGERLMTQTHSQAALDAWQQYIATYMFEWIARWPLIGVLLSEERLEETLIQAGALLEESQMQMPPAIDSALESALRMADKDDEAATYSLLNTAATLARKYNYL